MGFHASASAAQIVGQERELEQLDAALGAVTDLFVKRGASSRVEVARITERDRRERPGLVDAT